MSHPPPPGFDRSYLPPADFEFVVLADTHHIVDPEMYPTTGDSVTPELTREWSARGDFALSRVAALRSPLVFHIGDLAQEYPGHSTFERGRLAARNQLETAGLALNLAPGNMDIGDKPDATMPAGWVRAEDLSRWHSEFGPSYYSLTRNGHHFVVINSQILNTALDDAVRQREWLETDLATHAGKRTFLFMHTPPFLVDEHEPGLGSYDVLDEPDRSWILELVRRFDVEALFAAHVHFRTFNRVGRCRLYTLPSTTTTRPGFPEAFRVAPPSRGWADLAKLGFFLVRVRPDGPLVHVIRTEGRTPGIGGDDRRDVLTCVSRELSASPLGINLRLPITTKSEGAIAYPNNIRHRIRDDYPFLSCIELGARHVRFPIHDLEEDLQRARLSLLREEGLALTGFSIWAEDRRPAVPTDRHLDVLEVQLAGRALPTLDEVAAISALRDRGQSIALAPIVMERINTVHSRSRTGYSVAEVGMLDSLLSQLGGQIDRAVCSVDGGISTWTEIQAFASLQRQSIKALDFIVRLGTDDEANCTSVADALLACATIADCRLFIDGLQELDRTASLVGGLLDRLSNPRPAFHVARVLNTVVYSRSDPVQLSPMDVSDLPGQRGQIKGIANNEREFWLIGADARSGAVAGISNRLTAGASTSVIDLSDGRKVEVSGRDLVEAVAACPGSPLLIASVKAAVHSVAG